jgi:hypothetical protein
MAEERQPEMETPSQFQLGKLNGQDVYEATIQDFQHHLAASDFTSVELVEFCLERVQKVGRQVHLIMITASYKQWENAGT